MTIRTVDQRVAFVRGKDKVNIAYGLSGEGPPLVRAGTWLTHIQYDWDSPVWSHWLQFMSQRHTLVRYDPRGCGLSQKDIRSISLDDWIDDLEAVVDTLGLDNFPLFGMSQGAAVAVGYVLRHPERVSHLTLYAPLVTGWHRASDTGAQQWKNMEALVAGGWGEDNLAFPSMFAHLLMPDARPEHIHWYASLLNRTTTRDVAGMIMNALGEISLFSQLGDITVPTLVIQVARDQCIPPESTLGIASLIPDCSFASIDSSNHILVEDEPGWKELMSIFQQHVPCSGASTSHQSQLDHRVVDTLSKREREILLQLARGLSNQEIADALFISEKTVKNHITNVLAKLDVSSRAQAIVLAKDLGF